MSVIGALVVAPLVAPAAMAQIPMTDAPAPAAPAPSTRASAAPVSAPAPTYAPAAPTSAPAPTYAPVAPTSAPPPYVAPPAYSPPPAPAPASAGADVVYLVDGSQLHGTILKQEWGKFVVIQTTDGSVSTLDWSLVRSVTAATPPTQAEGSEGPVGVPAVRSAKGEAVTFVLAPPPRFTVNFQMGGFAAYASKLDTNLAGGGMELGVHGIIGVVPFPDIHGGSWHGVALQAYARVWGGGVWNQSDGVGFVGLHGGGGVGYTYMHLSDIDLDYTQRGVGVMGTWRFGDQNLWYFGNSGGTSFSGADAEFTTGPWLAVIFPKYAAHRGALSYSYLNADIVLSKIEGLVNVTFYEVGGGGAF